jgi:phage terminase large subunit-like protein
VRTTSRAGIGNAIESIFVRHVSGGISEIGLKSYEQGSESFQGTARHIVWLDEEPSLDIYAEALLRTMTVDGMVICTFTPLLGMSDVVRYFLDIKAVE